MNESCRRFIKEGAFVRNLTPKTFSTHEQAWKVYLRYSAEINQTHLNRFVIGMREAGITAWRSTHSPGQFAQHQRLNHNKPTELSNGVIRSLTPGLEGIEFAKLCGSV